MNQTETAPASDFLLSLWEQSLAYAKQSRWDVAEALFAASLRILKHAWEERKIPPKMAQLFSAEEYIRKSLDSVTVASLCEWTGLRERTLRNLFYGAYGCSPKQRITRIRLETAGELLSGTLLPIHEIASSLGFSSQFHFSRSFRQQYGISPSQ